MNNQSFWRSVTIVTYVAIALLAVLTIKELKAIGYVGTNPNITNSITVSGEGEAIAAPADVVGTFSFTVSETAKTVAAAQEAATTKLNAALKALRDQGVADKDLTTEGYNINPHYEYQNAVCPTASDRTVTYCPPGKSTITGYDVSQTVGVKVRDLSKAGALLTTIGGLNVQNVNGLTFSVDKPDALQAKARAEAISKAQSQAKVLADQLGVRLVRITSFSEYGNNPRPMYYGKGGGVMAADSAAAAPEVPTGEQKVTSNVTITYEIK